MVQKVLITIILLSFLLCGTAAAYVSDEFETWEEAEEWAEKIGTEYYEDPDYFNCYDETFDVFYNESSGRQLMKTTLPLFSATAISRQQATLSFMPVQLLMLTVMFHQP